MKSENENKRIKVPATYKPGFLDRLDGRLEVAKVLHSAYEEVCNDMGGMENLSHVQLTLAERFVFLEHFLRCVESQIALAPKEKEEMIGRWIQALNSLSGLAKTIGLERRMKKIDNIETYLRKHKNGKR